MKRLDAAVLGAVVLFIAYVLTLAPSVTFWDSGEFIAAAHSLGIPHPPGTPLYVLLIGAWANLLPVPFAFATNLFSAAVTALAAGVTARFVSRATNSRYMAISAALAAGGMWSVWLNATETEVYAASLALGVLMLWSGDHAGRRDDERWTALTAYLMMLSVPLHLSALVAAPAAIVLASVTRSGIRERRGLVLWGVFLIAIGVGRMAWLPCAVGAVIALSAGFVSDGAAAGVIRRFGLPATALALAAVAVSALLILLLRAQHDPAINQGNPGTLAALADVVARRQYAVSPMWPRQAPIWVQLGNLFQYADWQIALSLGPTVLPSVLRTAGTLLFVWLGFLGASAHYSADRRTWWGTLVLFVCGTLGVVAWLNLHAGPSIGYGILPQDTAREARERDYFFVFGFWTWGVWAGVGAVSLMSRLARPAWAGVLVAALPLVLNWRAVTRKVEPEAWLPRQVAQAYLESVPRDAVLFLVGDNDTYPLWYAQQAAEMRRDVTLVTIPLLPTRWYRAEIARRYDLLPTEGLQRFEGRITTASQIAARAREQGRPVAASIMATPAERARLGGDWAAVGLTYVSNAPPRKLSAAARDSGATRARPAPVADSARIDSAAVAMWAAWVTKSIPHREARAAIDPINAFFLRLLDCPRQLADVARGGDESRLDSACNYR